MLCHMVTASVGELREGVPRGGDRRPSGLGLAMGQGAGGVSIVVAPGPGEGALSVLRVGVAQPGRYVLSYRPSRRRRSVLG